MLSKLSYFTSEGFHNIMKSKIESLASITTISMCIFILGIMYMSFQTVSKTVEEFKDDIGIRAFLDSNTSSENLDALYEYVKEHDDVRSVEIVTKEEALIDFAGGIENGENMLEQYKDDNPLRDSLEIRLNDQEKIDDVVKLLEESSFVKKIIKPNDAVKFLTKLNDTVQKVSIFFIIILIAMSTALIINTVKLTVFIRKDDIKIMKYVGATDWFVRLPFIIEGILIGIIGTAVPLLILYMMYEGLLGGMAGHENELMYKFLKLKSTGEIYSVLLPLCSVIGVGIGTVGSIISIRKYLEV